MWTSQHVITFSHTCLFTLYIHHFFVFFVVKYVEKVLFVACTKHACTCNLSSITSVEFISKITSLQALQELVAGNIICSENVACDTVGNTLKYLHKPTGPAQKMPHMLLSTEQKRLKQTPLPAMLLRMMKCSRKSDDCELSKVLSQILNNNQLHDKKPHWKAYANCSYMYVNMLRIHVDLFL